MPSREMNHRREPSGPRILAFGGGGNGAGRSTLAHELSRVLARRSRVLLVDADLDHPTQHLRLDVRAVEPRRATSVADAILPLDGGRPDLLQLSLLSSPFGRFDLGVERLIAELRSLAYDTIVLDLPATPEPMWCSLFLRADVPVVCAGLEPASLMASTRFLRRCVGAGMVEGASSTARAAIEAAIGAPPWGEARPLPLAVREHGVSDRFDEAVDRFQPWLVLLQTREASERELGQVLALAWMEQTGIRPRHLGAVDWDDRRWFHLRQGIAPPPLTSDEGIGVQVEELARRLDGLDAMVAAQPRRPALPASPAAALLGVPDSADPLDVRLAYRRLWEGFRRDSTVTRTLMRREVRDLLLQALEEANRQLQTWTAERRASPPVRLPGTVPTPDTPAAAIIRRAREARGLTLRDLAVRTRIGLGHLQAIEEFHVDALPSVSHLRGYLREIARVLDLAAEPLIDDYLSRTGTPSPQRP